MSAMGSIRLTSLFLASYQYKVTQSTILYGILNSSDFN